MPNPHFISRYELAARVDRFPLDREQKMVLAIRRLLAQGIPVIVPQRVLIGSSTYRFHVIHGCDVTAGERMSDDSLPGRGHRIPYRTFGRLGGMLLIPIYLPETDAKVQSLIKELGARN